MPYKSSRVIIVSHCPTFKTTNMIHLLSCTFLVVSVLAGTDALVTSPSSLEVHLTSGNFVGLSVPNGTERWLGIPFAQPPIGGLRFKAPVPITRPSSNAVKNASEFADACPQVPTDSVGAPMSEDCLYLNVWRPKGTSDTEKLPVLVWFYGGAFMQGYE
ncbi:Alpha/Beta hydrolase protein [Abortiporus biennis]|nr:Alpha/Beta hydrolase protein [Abortiporus biennis]